MKLMKIEELVLYDTDFSSYKIEYNKIDGEGTKRNLAGTMRRQVVANKSKICTATKSLIESDKLRIFLEKVTKDTLVIEYYDTKTKTYKTINCYCGVPAPDIEQILNDEILYKAMNIDFIEL